uniref:EF-hand domain-containing protein n=1 Tax=Haptolina brevifila TaxID=156173 RepID=A0A7S2CKY8_9EUKA
MAVRTQKIQSGSGYTIGTLGAERDRLKDIDYLRTAFDSFDVDKSGFIDPQELCAALTMLGIRGKLSDDLGVEDKDSDGVISLKDLDKNGDEKIDFDEFKVLAAVLPKRDHPIYRNALQAKEVTLPRDESRVTPVQRNQHAAQQATKKALDDALRRLRKKLNITTDSKLMNDSNLQKQFAILDSSGDGRVDLKELIKLLKGDQDLEITTREAWLLMNCADTNNDKVMTFDEFKRMLQTVARAVDMEA